VSYNEQFTATPNNNNLMSYSSVSEHTGSITKSPVSTIFINTMTGDY